MAKEVNGHDIRLLDYFVSRNFKLGDRALTVKVGNHVINERPRTGTTRGMCQPPHIPRASKDLGSSNVIDSSSSTESQ